MPLLAPLAAKLGIDLVWFGVLVGVNLQTSFLHPPFGYALFFLRAITPSHIRSGEIYLGALPWVGLQLIVVMLVIAVPQLVTMFFDAGPVVDMDKAGEDVKGGSRRALHRNEFQPEEGPIEKTRFLDQGGRRRGARGNRGARDRPGAAGALAHVDDLAEEPRHDVRLGRTLRRRVGELTEGRFRSRPPRRARSCRRRRCSTPCRTARSSAATC